MQDIRLPCTRQNTSGIRTRMCDHGTQWNLDIIFAIWAFPVDIFSSCLPLLPLLLIQSNALGFGHTISGPVLRYPRAHAMCQNVNQGFPGHLVLCTPLSMLMIFQIPLIIAEKIRFSYHMESFLFHIFYASRHCNTADIHDTTWQITFIVHFFSNRWIKINELTIMSTVWLLIINNCF